MQRYIGCALAFAVACLLAVAPARAQGQETEVVDSVVAVVNGEIVTMYDIESEIAARLKAYREKIGDRPFTADEQSQIDKAREGILEQHIHDLLLDQQVRRFGISVSDEDVDNYVESTMEERGWTREDYQEYLELKGSTDEEARENIRSDMLKQRILNRMVNQKVVVTEQDVREEFAKRKSEYSVGRILELQIILIPGTPDDARDITKRIEDGELTFAQAAQQYSEGPGADQGGDLGEVAWEDMAEPWRQSLEGVQVGGIGSPFDVEGKTAILRIKSDQDGSEVAYERHREELYEQVQEAKFQEVLKGYIDELREKAIIEYK